MRSIREALYRVGFRLKLIESAISPAKVETLISAYSPRHAAEKQRAA
jgi:hypothetical protein